MTAVSAAVDAVCRGDDRGFAEYLKLLAAEQSPGWTQAVSREIAGFLRLSVTAAWQHGWQPAELVRYVGRELGDAYADMAADMVVDEMRGYAPPMVDDRWAVQVSALGAEVWWGSDAEFLSARSGEPLRVAIELLHLLQHVPVLERLCPLPGTARAGAWAAGSDADERILGKIRALLAKAESTEFPDEAEALSARVQELMAKHSINHALLAAQSASKDRPAARRLRLTTRMSRRRRRSCTLSRKPIAAGRSGRRQLACPRWSVSRPTWTRWSCCTRHCWCRLTRRCCGRARRGTPTGGRGPGGSASRSWWPTRTGSGCGCRRRLCTQSRRQRLPRPARTWCRCSKSATRLSITPSTRCW